MVPPGKKGADGEARQRIYVMIQDHPGIHKSEIARRLDLTSSTVAYHVMRLERAGLVRSARVGRTNHLVATGQQPRGAGDVLLDPNARRILALLEDGRIHSPGDIRAASGIGEKAVRRTLQRLSDAEFIRCDGAYHPRYWMPGWRGGQTPSRPRREEQVDAFESNGAGRDRSDAAPQDTGRNRRGAW